MHTCIQRKGFKWLNINARGIYLTIFMIKDYSFLTDFRAKERLLQTFEDIMYMHHTMHGGVWWSAEWKYLQTQNGRYSSTVHIFKRPTEMAGYEREFINLAIVPVASRKR